MPNWTSIELEFEGDPNVIAQLRTDCFTDNNLDFEKIIPKPEGFNSELMSPVSLAVEQLLTRPKPRGLMGLIASASPDVRDYAWVKEAEPASGWTKVALVAFLHTRKKLMTDAETLDAYREVEQLVKAYQRNVELTGFSTWYDWNCSNWGTKWNACDCHITEGPVGYLQVLFDTAWDAPRPIFKALRAKYPQLRMKWVAEFEGDSQIEGQRYWPEEGDE